MGTLRGHVYPGASFLLIGVWHLFNHVKLYLLNPKAYVAPHWFPFAKCRHLELILIMLGSLASISLELFLGPSRHQPLDHDGTIPSYHLHNFEHASISLTFLIYAAFTMAIDRRRGRSLPNQDGLMMLLGGMAFGQEWFNFHYHSTDHFGVEGQYHWLLQMAILLSFGTTLLGIPCRRSFLVGLVRSASIAFQGVWFIVIGLMVYIPSFLPKGCFPTEEGGRLTVGCHTEEALSRAKSLINLEFSWYVTASVVLVMLFYLYMCRVYYDGDEKYLPLMKEDAAHEEEEGEEDLSPKKHLNMDSRIFPQSNNV